MCREAQETSSLPRRLRIIHITDVYQLDNFPSLSTLISEKRNEHADMHTISLLSGDFLMPYLLSKVDGGRGMMSVLNALPMDYLTWGNHETDLPHDQLMQREAEYTGQWINTNMKSHESFKTATSSQIDHKMFTLRAGDGTVKNIAFLGILTNDLSVLPPGSFGGATVDDPWKTMREYQDRLQNNGVDLIVPICHLYESEDARTVAEFDFPLILGGHDHHMVNRNIDGTLLLKPGADSHYAGIVDLYWSTTDDDSELPRLVIEHEMVRVSDYAPNPDMQRLVDEAYRVLEPLQQTQLDCIPDWVERPLTSEGSRSQCVSVASYFGGQMRRALQWKLGGPEHVDAFIGKGGFFHGGQTYDAPNQQLTLEMLLAEVDNEDVFITEIPGRLLQVGLRETWEAPGTGWFQYDDAVVVDPDTKLVTYIGGQPLELDRLYRIATTKDFFRARDGRIIGSYYEEDPTRLPPKHLQFGIHDLLFDYIASKWWSVISKHVDANGNGELDPANILYALEHVAELQTHPQELTLVHAIMDVATGRRLGETAATSQGDRKDKHDDSMIVNGTNHKEE